jgi:AmmeMemoRadiSam system protein A
VEGCLIEAGDRRTLLAIAREAIRAKLRGDDRVAILVGRWLPGTDDPKGSFHEGALGRPGAAFVTLRSRERLRGCIGHLEPDRPLAAVVANAAVAAAFEDPRFPPVAAGELDDLTIEISVLGPFVPVPDPLTIEVGRHGLVVRSGWRRGLLLPQVAPEWGWTREEFLAQTCLKAGLPADAWRKGTEIFCFEAEVFGEHDSRAKGP